MPVGGYVPVPSDPQFDDVDLTGNIEESDQSNETASANVSKFSLDYYRSYFDVDTYQVIQRALSGFIPFSKRFSLVASLKPVPDLYGPFWITVTIIFSVAFSGSIYEYIQSNDATALSTFNFGRVTISTMLLFLYWCLMPALLTSIVYFRRRKLVPDVEVVENEPEIKYASLFTELLAIYGYSMTSFIPAAMLLCIPINYLQYTVIAVACILSLVILCTATWSTFKQRRKQLAVGLLVLIIVAHLVMTISLSVVFFHQPPRSVEPVPPPRKPDGAKLQDELDGKTGGEKQALAKQEGGEVKLNDEKKEDPAAVKPPEAEAEGAKKENAPVAAKDNSKTKAA